MKLLRMVISFVLCMALSLSFSAHTIDSDFYYQDKDITVVFDADSVFSSEQKQFIADILVLGEPIVDDGASTYALCWLTGHDIVSESVSVVEHKVSDTDPRCRRDTYIVETCTNCDYLEYSLVSSSRILCCPEE